MQHRSSSALRFVILLGRVASVTMRPMKGHGVMRHWDGGARTNFESISGGYGIGRLTRGSLCPLQYELWSGLVFGECFHGSVIRSINLLMVFSVLIQLVSIPLLVLSKRYLNDNRTSS